MKTVTISINEATALSQAIQLLSEIGADKRPIYKLPFKFSYPLARTLTKLQEALKPIQEKNQEIFEGWDEENRKLQDRIKAAEGPMKEKAVADHSKAFKVRNDKWKEVAGGSIEVEVYEFQKFTEAESEAIMSAGLTPVLLAQLAPMNLCLDEAA